MKDTKVNQSAFRLIKRMSDDCTIYVAENDNGHYVVVQDDEIKATFEHQQDAYRMYGVMTRQKKGEQA